MRDKGASHLRAAAWASFAELGLPNRRVESWHYTDLKTALEQTARRSPSLRRASLTIPRAR